MPTNRALLAASACGALLIMVLLAGCSFLQPAPTAIPTTIPPTPTPLPRGGNLTIRLAEDVPELRPWQPRTRGEEQLATLLYSGLMRLDDRLRPQPDLAAGYSASPDGLVITFTLRASLQWHDGTPLTAADAAFTLERLRALPITSTALIADLQRITRIEAPTTDTLILTLAERYAPLLAELTVPILPQHLLERTSLEEFNAWEQPVGSGPFAFVERRPGQAVVLEANPNFHRGAPLLDRVAFVVAPDPQVAVDALRSGELMLAELPWEAAQALADGPNGLRRGNYAENGYYFLAFNLREGRPFADVRLREALALVIDLPQIVAGATAGQGQVIGNSAAPGSWADLTPASGSADPARAAELLDAAGWTLPPGAQFRQRDGITLTASLVVRQDDPRRLAIASGLANAAATAGIDMRVAQADFESAFRARLAPPYDFDLLLGSWINGVGDAGFGDYAYYDPDDFDLFHSSQINQGPGDTRPTLNFIGYDDPVYDNQAQAARQLYALEDRSRAIAQLQSRVAMQRPYLFLWADRIPVLLNERVRTREGPITLDSAWYFWNIEAWYVE